MAQPIPTRITPSVPPTPLSTRQVEREFHALIEGGARLVCDGRGARKPLSLLRDGYTPKHKLDLFGTQFYFANVRQNPLLRFFVVYVVPPAVGRARRSIYVRIFYKDVSLLWRCGSHIVYADDELWIGKGDVTVRTEGEHEITETLESTTDLPFEMQTAMETLMRRAGVARRDTEILPRVLRNAPANRLRPYRDFTEPRLRAAACPKNLIHRGKRVARFKRKNDPSSLVFVPGYEPDFRRGGILDQCISHSASYGGEIVRHRILSTNRMVQYLFFSAPRHVWLAPPQALTTELSSYGVRTVDVAVDDDLSLPGYEYHFLEYEGQPDSLHSQIPEGFAGAPNPSDPDRADASAWLDQMPVIKSFRHRVLGRS